MRKLLQKIGKYFHSTSLFQLKIIRPFAIFGRRAYNKILGKAPIKTTYNFSLFTIPNDECIRLFLLLDGYFEKGTSDLFHEIIKPGDVFVDIGANIGYFSVMACRLGAKVYSFEPVSSYYEILKKNINYNKCKDFELYNYGLGSEETSMDIYIDKKNPGGSSVIKRDRNKDYLQNTINIKKLDDVIKTKVDIIKIDVEGFEYDVLLGAKKFLSQESLKIIIEFAPLDDSISGLDKKELPKKIINILLEFGFNINVIDENNSGITSVLDYEDFIKKYGYGGLYNLYAVK